MTEMTRQTLNGWSLHWSYCIYHLSINSRSTAVICCTSRLSNKSKWNIKASLNTNHCEGSNRWTFIMLEKHFETKPKQVQATGNSVVHNILPVQNQPVHNCLRDTAAHHHHNMVSLHLISLPQAGTNNWSWSLGSLNVMSIVAHHLT